jgi:DNA-binding transcriptional regulator GbsR (MarR family)
VDLQKDPYMMNREEQHFAEEVGLFFEQVGLSRTDGRILGWLLIADPPDQTMMDIVEALQVSKSSVSTSTRALIQFGMVERVSKPGERRDDYRLRPNLWTHLMQLRLDQSRAFQNLAERGLDLLADAPPERRHHLEEMRELYRFFERILEECLEERKSKE